MTGCRDCELPQDRCICSFVTKFFEENGDLMESLSEQEARDRGYPKCVACFFHDCRCSVGHKKRLEKI